MHIPRDESLHHGPEQGFRNVNPRDEDHCGWAGDAWRGNFMNRGVMGEIPAGLRRVTQVAAYPDSSDLVASLVGPKGRIFHEVMNYFRV